MKKKTNTFLLTVLLAVLGLTTVSEARQTTTSLTAAQKALVPIAAFTASGDLDKLKSALHKGLDAGLTVNQTKEILVHLYAYCGFPRSLNAVNTFMAVMEERQAQGIQDEMGVEALPMPDNIDKNEYGMLVRQKLFGWSNEPAPSGYQVFAPAIDTFLKEHLFADIFYRDNLDYVQRELVTISALANMTGTNPQLQSHMQAAMNVGITEAQMKDWLATLGIAVGKGQANNAASLLAQLLK